MRNVITWPGSEVSRSSRICYPVTSTSLAVKLCADHIAAWIADTGIGEQRDAVKAKEADQSLRQKTRERVQPKMGKIDIDYQKLHDAFFRFQSKPSMSKFGEA